jgi:hypothetical protein
MSYFKSSHPLSTIPRLDVERSIVKSPTLYPGFKSIDRTKRSHSISAKWKIMIISRLNATRGISNSLWSCWFNTAVYEFGHGLYPPDVLVFQFALHLEPISDHKLLIFKQYHETPRWPPFCYFRAMVYKTCRIRQVANAYSKLGTTTSALSSNMPRSVKASSPNAGSPISQSLFGKEERHNRFAGPLKQDRGTSIPGPASFIVLGERDDRLAHMSPPK